MNSRYVVTIDICDPGIGISIMLNLYLSPLKASIPCFIASNSAPKTDVPTADSFFVDHLYNKTTS